MKLRNAAVLSILVILGIACVGAVRAVYTDVSVKASAPEFAAGLKFIPSDYQFVFGVNVQKLAQSRTYSSFRQASPANKDLALFTEKTGLDPARDIYYLVGGGNGKEKASGILIASGAFNKGAIMNYARAKSAAVEQSYAGTSILVFADAPGNSVQKGIAFVDDQEIALGDVESLKLVLDIRGQENRSILNNRTMMSLVRSVDADEMFWFAGDAFGLISSAHSPAPLAAPLQTGGSNIKYIVGSLNIGDALTGKVTATAITPEQATKLADAVRGLIALGQFSGDKNPALRGLLGGVTVTQNSDQVRLDLNVPADVLTKMGQRTMEKLQ